MKYKHVFEIRVRASQFEVVQKVIDGINKDLNDFGLDEKIDFDISVAEVSITNSKKLNKEEITKAEHVLKQALVEQVPEVSTVIFKEVLEISD